MPADAASPWREVRATFRDYFRNWDLVLPRSLAGKTGVIMGKGWRILWRAATVRGRVCLDFYATHRMTNDRHYRIWQGGELRSLPAMFDMILFPAGASQAEENAIRERHARRSSRIARLVAGKFRDAARSE